MTLITDTWRQLVQRRLWPVAVLLLAALVAVPMLLAKNPEPVAPAPAPATGAAALGGGPLDTEPVVAVAKAPDAKRHVLGARKDPFRPAIIKKVKPAATPSATRQTTQAPSGGASAPSGGPTGGGTSAPVVGGGVTPGPVVTGPPTPAPRKKSFPADSLTVRFGAGPNDPKSVLEKGKPLPADSGADGTPLLVYLGLSKDGRQALFLVDASVKADGDGHCDTGDTNQCQTLRMRAGDTEFLDVSDDTGKVTGQFELDLVAIHTDKKPAKAANASLAAKAHAALAGAASVGRATLGAGVAALLGSL